MLAKDSTERHSVELNILRFKYFCCAVLLAEAAAQKLTRACLCFVRAGADVTVSQSLLTQQGVPVVGLSNGKSYCFSLSLETW